MDVKVVNFPPVKVAYLRYVGPYGAGVGQFWAEKFVPWAVSQGLMGAARYGVGLDDPGVTEPSKCRYDTCVQVGDGYQAKSPAGTTTLPGGRYAVSHFYGTGAQVALAWTELLRDWLPQSGMQADARPYFEYYPSDARYDPKTGEFECQLCLPVVAL